ncbi:hypothetical protein ABIC56_002169 [Acinetobacter bereziniae]|nr:hypothetical protein [Acinetobacter bereziniae]
MTSTNQARPKTVANLVYLMQHNDHKHGAVFLQK